jgi:catecholate siderophore receptor
MSLPSPRASLPRSSSVPAFLALSCVGAFATAPAYAADADKAAAPVTDAQQREEILVNGQRIHDEGPKQVAPLVNTPRSVIVLPKEVIEQTGSNSLADALRTVPGITFGAAEGGNPIGDRPFIRGFDSQGSIYVDGVRDLAAQTREVFAVDSVQIVRGSDSTLGGRGSAGGTINVLSRLPQLDTFGSLSASYGEADYKRVTGDVNLKVSDTAALRIEGMWHDQDVAGRDAIWQKRWGIAPSFAVGLGTPTRLTASFYHMESSELPDSGIPYLYTIANHPGTGNVTTQPALGTVTTAGGQTGYVSRKNFYGLAARDFRDATTNQATIRVEHDFGGITLRNTARYTHSDQSYIFTLPDDSQGNVYGSGYVWTRGNTRYGYSESIVDQTDLYGKFATGAIEHSFSLGTEISSEKTRRGTFVSANGSTISPRCNTATIARSYCVSLFDPNPYAPWVNYTSDTSTTATPIVKGAPSTETQNDANTKAVYAFDSITLMPALILNLGARYDRFESTITLPGATQTKVNRVDNLFNWQAGLIFKPTSETSLYASYATAATPPNSLLGEGREDNTITVATLSVLKPQKTKSYEVGAKASLFGEKLQLGAAVFQTDISNARVLDDTNTASFIGETRIRGVEFNVSGTILPGWTLFGGFTHLDPKIIDGGFTALTVPVFSELVNGVATVRQPAKTTQVVSVNTGKQVPQTARNSFTATTNIDVTKRLQIGGTALYMDEQIGGYADNRTATQTAAGVVSVNAATKILTRSIPDYWRFDARASYKLTDTIDLSVNAQNVTNKTYFTQTFTNHYAAIAAGRTVFGTVNLRF